MAFDALAMHAITAELRDRIEGGRIDRALLLDDRRVGLEVFAKGRRPAVVFDLVPDASRVFVTDDRLRRVSDRVTPFALLLRKYVAGSRVVAVEQPRLERLLRFQLSARVDSGIPRDVELIAEVMGRRANLVLVDEDGTIMDALLRVPPGVNPSRPLLPHLRYTAPLAESKMDPADPSLGRTLQRVATSQVPAWRLIVQQVAGFSPLVAREALVRATGDAEILAPDVRSWEEIAGSIARLAEPIKSGAWEPSVAQHEGRILDFAPYRLTQFDDAEVIVYPSMSDAVIVAAQRQVSASAFDRLKRPLLDALAARLEQARRKRGSLERSLAASDSADELRESGEAILSNAHAIEPGTTSLIWQGRRVDLYPTLSPVENAQSYFKRYTDARDAKSAVPPLLAQVALELEHLEEMAFHVQMADSEKTINGIRRELEDAGLIRRPATKKNNGQRAPKPSSPSGVYSRVPIAGGEILLGSSATGNEWVTFHLAKPDDVWLHARGVPGAHVILRNQTGEPGDQQLMAAARVAASRSAARDAGTVEVDYTLRKYVRKIRGAAPGRVTYRHERTIAVTPGPAEQPKGVGLRPTPLSESLLLDAAGDLVPELLLGHEADDAVDFLPALEQN